MLGLSPHGDMQQGGSCTSLESLRVLHHSVGLMVDACVSHLHAEDMKLCKILMCRLQQRSGRLQRKRGSWRRCGCGRSSSGPRTRRRRSTSCAPAGACGLTCRQRPARARCAAAALCFRHGFKSTRGEAASATTAGFGVMMTGGQCTCRRAGGRLQRRRRRGLRRTLSGRARLQCKGDQMGTPSCHMP